MSKVTIRHSVSIEIQTNSVIYDTEAGFVRNWSATASFQGRTIAKTEFGQTFKTEKSAISAIKRILKTL